MDVHIRQDRIPERRGVPEPVHEGAGQEGARERHFPLDSQRPPPRTREPFDDDRPKDHDEEEVQGEVVRRNERRGDEEERHHRPTVRPKAHEAQEAREGEELPDGCRRRVRRRVRDRDRASEERGGE